MMILRHAKVIVQGPRYLEAQRVIAEAEAAEKAAEAKERAKVEAEVE